MMKTLLLSTILTLFCISCEKDAFDPYDPDIDKFVHHLVNGTYNCYEKGENGENLWLIMPKFKQNHIRSLLDFSGDTSHIINFPVNPVSSRTPFPEGRDYFILAECLLWAVEGIRNGTGYGSLDPYLIDTTSTQRYKGLKGNEILIVKDYYEDWWVNYMDKNWQDINPLEGTSYHWF